MNPLHKHKIMSVGYQVKQNLKSGDMENLNSLLKFWVWESVRKIDPATGVMQTQVEFENKSEPLTLIIGPIPFLCNTFYHI